MTTAEKVRALIEKKVKSQAAFARSLGMHPVSLCKNLKDDNLSMKTLSRISDKYQVSIDSLLPDDVIVVNEEKPLVNGYIEYNGKIEAVRSVEDLERIWKSISGDGETAKPVSKNTKPVSKKAKTKSEATEREYDIRCSDEGYAYFYKDVPLSNWWDSVPAIQYDGHSFNASESIFMYLKAKYFKDEETAAKIVEADNKTYDQPKKRWAAVKRFGKKVKGFDDKKWAGPNRKAMYVALKQKAMYDTEFKRVLLDPKYAGMTFCEASKYDKIWGIGINATTALREGKAGWKGHNFLGKALTDLRNELRPDLEKKPQE